jgi:hypothetical protein
MLGEQVRANLCEREASMRCLREAWNFSRLPIDCTVRALIQKTVRPGQGPSVSIVFWVFGMFCFVFGFGCYPLGLTLKSVFLCFVVVDRIGLVSNEMVRPSSSITHSSYSQARRLFSS